LASLLSGVRRFLLVDILWIIFERQRGVCQIAIPALTRICRRKSFAARGRAREIFSTPPTLWIA